MKLSPKKVLEGKLIAGRERECVCVCVSVCSSNIFKLKHDVIIT